MYCPSHGETTCRAKFSPVLFFHQLQSRCTLENERQRGTRMILRQGRNSAPCGGGNHGSGVASTGRRRMPRRRTGRLVGCRMFTHVFGLLVHIMLILSGAAVGGAGAAVPLGSAVGVGTEAGGDGMPRAPLASIVKNSNSNQGFIA
jgi:hypothetical protein